MSCLCRQLWTGSLSCPLHAEKQSWVVSQSEPIKQQSGIGLTLLRAQGLLLPALAAARQDSCPCSSSTDVSISKQFQRACQESTLQAVLVGCVGSSKTQRQHKCEPVDLNSSGSDCQKSLFKGKNHANVQGSRQPQMMHQKWSRFMSGAQVHLLPPQHWPGQHPLHQWPLRTVAPPRLQPWQRSWRLAPPGDRQHVFSTGDSVRNDQLPTPTRPADCAAGSQL